MFPESEQAAHQPEHTPGSYVEPGKPNGQSSPFAGAHEQSL